MKKQCLLKGIALQKTGIKFVMTFSLFMKLTLILMNSRMLELMEQRLNLVGQALTIVVDTSLTKRYVITS